MVPMVSFLASKYIQFTSDVIMTSSWYFTWAFRLIGFGRVSRDRLVECWVWLRLFWLVDSGSIQNGWFVIGWVWLAEVRFFEVRIGLNYVIFIFCVGVWYVFVRFKTTNLKKKIVSQKNRTWSGTRSNEFHEFSSKCTGQRKSGIAATAIYSKRSIWPSFDELGLLWAQIIRFELTVVLMVSWLLFLYHWILNADWMLIWNFFRAIYFFDWYWLFCIRAHRLLYVHGFSCCALNMSCWYHVTWWYHVDSIRLHFFTSCTRMYFSLSVPSHVLIIIVNNSTMIIINKAHQINTATPAILLSKQLRAAF